MILDTLDETARAISQRTLAQRTGFSVGLVNAVLHKLIRTGYVKVIGLNRRSVQYFLTPKGMAEKTRKSYQYVLKTISQYRLMQEKMGVLLQALQKQGFRGVFLNGDGELRGLLEEILRQEFPWIQIVQEESASDVHDVAILEMEKINMTNMQRKERRFSLLDYLS